MPATIACLELATICLGLSCVVSAPWQPSDITSMLPGTLLHGALLRIHGVCMQLFTHDCKMSAGHPHQMGGPCMQEGRRLRSAQSMASGLSSDTITSHVEARGGLPPCHPLRRHSLAAGAALVTA